MKHIYLISALIILSTICFSQDNNSKTENNHHLNYREFINQYGTDDTSRAIIDIYFDKREYLGSGQMSFLPLSTAVMAVNPPIGLGLLAVSTPLFISGLITYHKYSKKHLLKTLTNYQKNNILTVRCKKKVCQLIEAEEAIHIEDLLEARFNATN